jgi:hypothetical protein
MGVMDEVEVPWRRIWRVTGVGALVLTGQLVVWLTIVYVAARDVAPGSAGDMAALGFIYGLVPVVVVTAVVFCLSALGGALSAAAGPRVRAVAVWWPVAVAAGAAAAAIVWGVVTSS